MLGWMPPYFYPPPSGGGTPQHLHLHHHDHHHQQHDHHHQQHDHHHQQLDHLHQQHDHHHQQHDHLHQQLDHHHQQHDHLHQQHDHHHQQLDHHHLPAEDPTCSSSREARNKAEKNRRDKLNLFIQELAVLVPSVAASPKRLDKTSILRHSAAYLRLHRINKPSSECRALAIPRMDHFDVMHHLLDDVGGILFVVTGSGKIVFVSDSVEKMLGHSESDLLGQSLFSLVLPADHEELRRNLSPDQDPMAGITERMLASSDDSSSDDTTATSVSLDSPCPEHPEHPDLVDLPDPLEPGQTPVRQKRSFFMRVRQRSVSKSDHVQYELVQVRGHLCIPPSRAQAQPRRRRTQDSSSNCNDVVLFAVVQMVHEPRICEQSLLEATKDEYITRHTMDGRIVYCDHRISLIAGYLSDEVAGLSAFKYMHKDDVRWTMVALRHMFNRCEDYGSSCYRLKSKTGDFIYLKTYGYLEKDNVTQALNSFICVNVLVSPEEGEEAIRDMHNRFSPLIAPKEKTRKSGVIITELPDEEEAATESEETLAPLVNELLLSSIPEHHSPLSPSGSSAPNEQFAKATFVSRNLPPVAIHTAMVGIKDMPSIPVPVAHSPRQPQSPSTAWSPRHVEDHSHAPLPARASVLCATGNILATEPPPPQQRPSIISGHKRPHSAHSTHHGEDDTKKTRTRRQRGDLASRGPLSVDVTSPPACPNGGWGRLAGTESPDLFATGGITNIEGFPLDATPAVPVVQPAPAASAPADPAAEQPGRAVQQQLILHHYQLKTDLDMQEEQITNMDQGLNQVPHDNPERRLIANSLVELKVERNRQEKILQELSRETLGV